MVPFQVVRLYDAQDAAAPDPDKKKSKAVPGTPHLVLQEKEL